MFFVFVPSVYSQLDITQLEVLQQLQQEDQDIDDPVEPYKDNGPLDNEALTDDQASTTEATDSFGYQGRNDFLVAPSPKFPNKPLKRFGYDYFLNQNTFIPTQTQSYTC
jgi:hypothetical protein